MASNKNISITFKLDGDGKGFQELAKDASGFKEVIRATVSEAQKLNKSIINWSQGVQAIDAITQTMGNLSSAISQYSEKLAEVQQQNILTTQLTGKTGDEMLRLRNSVQALSKHFGTDFNETLQAANTLSKAFGVSIDDAMKLVRDGLVSGANANGDFIDTLREYPRYFREAGLSAEEFVAIATNAAKQGIYSDKGVDVIKEGNLRIREMTTATADALDNIGISSVQVQKDLSAGVITTFNVMQMVASKLNELPASSSKVGTAIADIFGGPGEDAGLEYIKTLSNIQLNMEAVKAATNGTAEAQERQIQMQEQVKNGLSSLIDVSGIYTNVRPYVDLTAQVGLTAMGVGSFIKTLKALLIVQTATAVKLKALSASMLVFGLRATRAAAVTRIFSMALRSGAMSAAALKIALRGLLITSGIGAAFVAVTAIIEHFVSKSDEAKESVDDLSEAEQSYTSAAANTKQAIDGEIKKLSTLIAQKQDTAEAVKHLNETYGDIFGTYKTAAEWYDTLTKKSSVYAKQVGYEAQARVLSSKLAEKQIALELNAEKQRDLQATGKGTKKAIRLYNYRDAAGNLNTGVRFENVDSDEMTALKNKATELNTEISNVQKQLEVAQNKLADAAKEMANAGNGTQTTTAKLAVNAMTWQQVSAEIEATEKKLKGTTDPAEIKTLKAYNTQLKARKDALESLLGIGTTASGKKTAVSDPKTYEELNTNIEIYRKKLTGANTAEQKEIAAKIAAWEKAKSAIEEAQKQAARPTSLNTLESIDKELEYQRALRNRASKEAISGIDAEIKRLEELRAAFENTHVPTPVEAITTYKQLNEELSYYNDLLQTATEEERAGIQRQINMLEELRGKWDETLDTLKAPGDISTLNTLEELSDAIAYYEAQQDRQTADEIQNTQRVINALNAKKKALQRGMEIPNMQEEIDQINGLSGKEFKMKIRGIGFEELSSRIAQLREQLNDLNNPVTDGQRKDIESMIATYESWRTEVARSFEAYRDGWSGIKGISGGVDSITSALESNGSAWDKVTGIVDGFFQIYEGIKSVIQFINMLTTATNLQTAAETAKGVATVASTTAQTVAAGTAEAAAVAQTPVTIANKLATASYMELAAAEYMAAHAYIPFAGFGIGAGFTAAAAALVQSVGLMAFADGGIAYGPTLGLFGEYAGAASNPEVVAPLDKLRTLIKSDGEGYGKVRFEIEGRKLVGVLSKESKLVERS